MTPLLTLEHVTVVREGRAVLRDVSFCLPMGAHSVILGPNGSGKSTLIKTITRELYPAQGDPRTRFEIFGNAVWDVFALRRRLGIVSPDLLHHLTRVVTVRELVLSGFFSGLGLWPHNRVTPAMERRTRTILRFLGISHLAERPLHAMSSGENRRALIGRALVHQPRALILDEPTTSLDPKAVRDFRETLRNVARSGTTLVIVTHDLHDIIPDIRRAVLIKEGRIFADGAKRSVLTSRRLSQLFGASVRVHARGGYFSLM